MTSCWGERNWWKPKTVLRVWWMVVVITLAFVLSLFIFEEIFTRQFDISQNLGEQTRTDHFAGMNRNHRRPSSWMFQKDMASTLPVDDKTEGLQDGYDLFPFQGRKSG